MSMFKPQIITEREEVNKISNIINEAYFGDKPIEPLLKQLHRLRSPYLEKEQFFFNEFNTDPELFKFNRMLEEQFGFKACSVTLFNDKVINGWTYPVSLRNFKSGKDLISTSNGFKFKKEAEYCLIIFVYSGCMLSSEFTDREIMAMILHEIGHNFSAALSNDLSTIKDIQHICRIPILVLSIFRIFIPSVFRGVVYSSKTLSKLVVETNVRFRKDNPEICNIIDKFKGTKNLIGYIFTEIKDFLKNVSILTQPISVLIYNAIYKIKSINLTNIFFGFGYKKDEQLADNFATLYGYGPDNNSFLKKAEDLKFGQTTTKVVKDLPVLGFLQQLVIIPLEFLAYALDPHPKDIYRIMDSIKYLELELNNIQSDPKMKKEINNEIKELYNILEEYKEQDFNFNGNDLRAAYNTALINVYDNRSRKNIDKLYYDIDKSYINKKQN